VKQIGNGTARYVRIAQDHIVDMLVDVVYCGGIIEGILDRESVALEVMFYLFSKLLIFIYNQKATHGHIIPLGI
jgi:hypothetical protein